MRIHIHFRAADGRRWRFGLEISAYSKRFFEIYLFEPSPGIGAETIGNIHFPLVRTPRQRNRSPGWVESFPGGNEGCHWIGHSNAPGLAEVLRSGSGYRWTPRRARRFCQDEHKRFVIDAFSTWNNLDDQEPAYSGGDDQCFMDFAGTEPYREPNGGATVLRLPQVSLHRYGCLKIPGDGDTAYGLTLGPQSLLLSARLGNPQAWIYWPPVGGRKVQVGDDNAD